MKVIDSIQDSYNELVNKTSWPSWPELTNSAIVVLTASLLIAITIFAMDYSFRLLMDKVIYQMFY